MITIRGTSLVAAVAAASVLAAFPVAAQADNSPAGDIPDNQAFVTFRGAGYSLKVPEGWRRTQSSATVTFADKYNSIRAVVSNPRSRPSTKSELAKLKASIKGFSQPRVTVVRRPAGSAVLITYGATSAPNPVTGKSVTNDVERYAFWKGRKRVVLTLQAPKGSDNVDPWRIVTDSFAWKR